MPRIATAQRGQPAPVPHGAQVLAALVQHQARVHLAALALQCSRNDTTSQNASLQVDKRMHALC